MEDKAAGKRIKRFRERKAWTQEHLAAAAELSVRTVQRAEEGVLSAETLKAIAALDEPVETITRPDAGYPRITPIPFYDEAASVDWLVDAFGFRNRMRVEDPEGRIVHGEIAQDDRGCPRARARLRERR